MLLEECETGVGHRGHLILDDLPESLKRKT